MNSLTLQQQLSQTRGRAGSVTAKYSLPQLYSAQRKLLSWVESRTQHRLPNVIKSRKEPRRILLSTMTNDTNGTNTTDEVEVTHQVSVIVALNQQLEVMRYILCKLKTVYGTLNVCCEAYNLAFVADSKIW